MRLIDLDEFLRQNCVDRMEGKSCEDCKHHVLEVSCERLMEQPTIDPVKHGRRIDRRSIAAWKRIDYKPCGHDYECSSCGWKNDMRTHFCPNCGARMMEGEEG